MANLNVRALLIVGMVCVAVAVAGSSARAAPKTVFEHLMVPLSLDGEQVRLAVRIYRPEGPGPFPTLVVHHGSTGRGNKPELFARYWPESGIIEYFASRGWCVVFPSRRGRGGAAAGPKACTMKGLHPSGTGTAWNPVIRCPAPTAP